MEMVSYPEGTSWGLGGVLPIVGSGPGFVALNDRAVVQRQLVKEHRFLEDMKLLEEGLHSYVLLPLRSGARTIGVLAIGSQADQAFEESALARLQPLADSVALAFENVRLLQKTREMSITDEVTPLFNFRHFHQSLDRELKLVKRHGGVLSLLFIDLDRFKPINDTYGHLRGSRTLREVGFLIRAAVRDTDIPARYGGDEFVVILPQTDGPSALVLSDKLRRPDRGPRLPAGGGDQRAARRFSRRRDLPGRGLHQGGADPPGRQADVRGQGDAEGRPVIESAGTLLYRRTNGRLEVLIVHPWGPYNRRAPWSIPKGRTNPGEDLETAARRETAGGDRGPGRAAALDRQRRPRAQPQAHPRLRRAGPRGRAPRCDRPGGRRGQVRRRSSAPASCCTRPRSRSSTACSPRSTRSEDPPAQVRPRRAESEPLEARRRELIQRSMRRATAASM